MMCIVHFAFFRAVLTGLARHLCVSELLEEPEAHKCWSCAFDYVDMIVRALTTRNQLEIERLNELSTTDWCRFLWTWPDHPDRPDEQREKVLEVCVFDA